MRNVHRYLTHLYMMLLISALIVACTQLEMPKPDDRPMPTPPPAVEIKPGPPTESWALTEISWETRDKKNIEWSIFVADLLSKELLEIYDQAKDFERFCPAYRTLNKGQKVNAWTEFISLMAKYESNWNITSRMHETTMGIDPITKKPVYSEGLLQLSYQDIMWAKYCNFDWPSDKSLDPLSPKKTIFDPKKNLSCGMRILGNQIKNKGKVVLSSGVYWAILKEGGKYQQIPAIIQGMKKLKFCEVKK